MYPKSMTPDSETKLTMVVDAQDDLLYRSIVNTMSDGVLVHDQQGIVHLCNPSAERILGRPAHELIGHSIIDINWNAIREDGSPFPPDQFPGMITLRTGAIFSGVVMGLHQLQGDLVWISVKSRPLINAGENMPHDVLVNFTDVTERQLLLNTLNTTEAKFQNIFKHAAIGMALIATDGYWLEVNGALCNMLGYTANELYTKTFQDVTHPDDLERSLIHLKKLKSGEISSYQTEKRYIHKQGHEVWAFLTVSAVRDEAGKILYFVDQIEDITERRQAEQDLQLRLEQEREFQTYLKALHEITVELTGVEDVDTFYRRAVELGLERLGFERLGLLLYDPERNLGLGTYGTDLSGKLMREDHIAFQPNTNDGIFKQTFNSEIRFVVKKDAPLYHNMQVIGHGWNAAAVLWNGEVKLGWLAIDNGITGMPIPQNVLDILALYAMSLGTLLAQKRSQTALVNQRNLLRTLIDNLPDVIYVKDLQSRFVLVNRAFMKIMDTTNESDVIGKWDFDIHTPERAQSFWDEEQKLLKSGETLRERVEQVVYPNGQVHHLAIFKTPLRDSHGNIIGLVGANRDVTERLELEAALLDKERLETTLVKELELSELKSRMMERISHEFRTPLSIIQLTTETYTNYYDRLKPEQKASKIAAIRQATRQLTEMLNEIAIVVEDHFAAENLSLADLNLRYIIESNAHELDVQNNVLGKFVMQIPEVVMLKADRDVIQTALFHIMHNAVQYSAPRSAVHVKVTTDEAGIQMSFADQGLGIMPEELPRIFDPFFRGSNIDEVSGLGVGLTIAAKGIEAHRGRISIDSLLGQGTTVTIYLPHHTSKNGRP